MVRSESPAGKRNGAESLDFRPFVLFFIFVFKRRFLEAMLGEISRSPSAGAITKPSFKLCKKCAGLFGKG